MRVKLFGMMAGPGGCFMAGEIVDVSDAVGMSLIETRQAEQVGEKAKVVTDHPKKERKRK